MENATVNLPAHLVGAINEIIQKEGFNSYAVEARKVNTNGESYMSDLFTINIKGKTAESDKQLNLFVKTMMVGEVDNEVVSVSNVFLLETFAYDTLNKLFTKLQCDANIPIEERFEMINVYETSDLRSIILENMAIKGYKTYDRFKIIPVKLAELCVKNLAKFHALSFVIEKKDPDFHERQIKHRKINCDFNEYSGFINHVFDNAVDVLSSGEAKIRLHNFSKTALDRCKFLAEEKNTKVCVLNHGDFRINNLLVQVQDDEFVKVIPIDYQQMAYGHPLKDFFYFIFGSTDQEFRKNHLNYLKDLYYNSLRHFLTYFSIRTEDVWPREQFEKDFVERLDYGIVVGPQIFPFILAAENEIPDISKQGLAGITISKNNPVYRERIKDLVDEAMKWGII